MNRAIATLNRIKAENKAKKDKIRKKKDRNKPYNLKNPVEIRFRLPTKWRNQLQQQADTHTNGNLSEYMRQIIEKELKT